MPSILVVADTDLPPAALLQRLAERADLIVAADGGADRALEAGLRVDWVVGDLDGIGPMALARVPKARIRKDLDPDTTDLEKALRFVARRRPTRVVLAGVIGGRLDHTVGTLAILAAWHRRFPLSVVDEHFTTSVVERSTTFRAPVGTMVSLLAPAGARGVTTRGLRWPLKDHDLPFSTLGIHNEVARNPAGVRVREGLLFLMRSHGVRRHA